MAKGTPIKWTDSMIEIVRKYYPNGGYLAVQKHLHHISENAIRSIAHRNGIAYLPPPKKTESRTDSRDIRTPLDELFAPKPRLKGFMTEYDADQFTGKRGDGLIAANYGSGIQSGFTRYDMAEA